MPTPIIPTPQETIEETAQANATQVRILDLQPILAGAVLDGHVFAIDTTNESFKISQLEYVNYLSGKVKANTEDDYKWEGEHTFERPVIVGEILAIKDDTLPVLSMCNDNGNERATFAYNMTNNAWDLKGWNGSALVSRANISSSRFTIFNPLYVRPRDSASGGTIQLQRGGQDLNAATVKYALSSEDFRIDIYDSAGANALNLFRGDHEGNAEFPIGGQKLAGGGNIFSGAGGGFLAGNGRFLRDAEGAIIISGNTVSDAAYPIYLRPKGYDDQSQEVKFLADGTFQKNGLNILVGNGDVGAGRQDVGAMRIQFGEVNVTGNNSAVVVLPAAFANAAYQVTMAIQNTAGAGTQWNALHYGNKTTTQFTVRNNSNTDTLVSWIAIGAK